MKIPSFSYLADAFSAVLRRFPLVMLAAFAGVLAAMILIERPSSDGGWEETLVKMLLTAALALPTFLCAAIAAEKWQLSGAKKWLPAALAALLLAAYFLTLDVEKANDFGVNTGIRFIGLSLAAHLLVACVAYLDETPVADFWEYNKRLFGNFVVGAFYSGVIYTGLAVAILAVDELFNANIDEEIYGHLFVVVAGIFNTAYFLANFPLAYRFGEAQPEEPADLPNPESPIAPIPNPYTTAFKNLSKFILIPIVGLYFLILYAYSVKILVQWNLPHGWVGSLVLGFSVAGVFTYLLNYLPTPLEGGRGVDDSALVSGYRRWFFWVLLPMVALLFVAIGRRVGDYGVTEERYVVVAAGVWLLATCLYFMFSKKDNIKFIPASLAAVALVTVLGPLSAFQVSERNQVARLKAVLEKNGMLSGGVAVPAKDTLAGADAERIRSILHYLREHEHFHAAAPLFPNAPGMKAKPDYSDVEVIIRDLKVGYGEAPSNQCSFDFPVPQTLDVRGYEQMWRVESSDYRPDDLDAYSGFLFSEGKTGLDFYEKGELSDNFDLAGYLQKLEEKHGCPPTAPLDSAEAVVNLSGSRHDVKLSVQHLFFEKKEEKRELKNLNAVALVRQKE